MESVIITTIAKGSAIYFLALFLTRVIGKKMIAQMNFFDFVMGVSMGSIIASSLIDKNYTTISEVTALILFACLTVTISFLSIKSRVIRNIVTPQPTVLVENGLIIDKSLRKLRLTINELMMKLREKDIFAIEDIEYAIMERDGQVSVLVKPDKNPLTPYDMNIKVSSSGLLRDIIIDGNIIKTNLQIAGINEKWLEAQLKSNGIKSLSEVFYAGIDKNKKLNISKKLKEDDKTKDDYGIE